MRKKEERKRERGNRERERERRQGVELIQEHIRAEG
jgi:hypothetical protein